jgi:hypothetical protein
MPPSIFLTARPRQGELECGTISTVAVRTVAIDNEHRVSPERPLRKFEQPPLVQEPQRTVPALGKLS